MCKKLISIVLISLGLVSCGGGSESSSPASSTPTSSTATTSVAISVKDIQKKYVTGVATYFGNDGQHSASTGSIVSGGGGLIAAYYTGVPVGSYDGHLTVNGYNLSMYGMNTNTNMVAEVPFYQDTPKQIDVGITVVGSTSTTHGAYFKIGNHIYSSSIVGGVASFTLTHYGSNLAITGEIFVTQGVGTSSAGNLVLLGGTGTVSLGQQSFAAVTIPAPPRQNFTADFTGVPATPFLAKINSVAIPTGLSLSSIYSGGAAITSGFSLPDDIYSSARGVDYWLVKARDVGANNLWFAQGPFTVGQSLDVSTSFTSLITASAQSGNTISWVNAQSTSPITLTTVEVVDVASSVKWKATFDGDVTSWTLPSAPTLLTGSYTLNITNIIVPNLTKEQYAEGLAINATPLEVMQLKGVSYTH